MNEDSSVTMNELEEAAEQVRARLLANDPTLTGLYLHHEFCKDDLALLFEALKKNTMIKSLTVWPDIRIWNTHSWLGLVDAISNHPTLERVIFHYVSSFENSLHAIASVFKRSDKLSHVEFIGCWITPEVNNTVKRLLTENAITSLTVNGPYCDGEYDTLDLSGALEHNTSIKKLVLLEHDDYGFDLTVSEDTIREIPLMLRGNQGVTEIRLTLNDELDAVLIPPILYAVMFHKSLSSFVLNGITIDDFTAKTLGYMVQMSPALRKLDLSGCFMSMVGFELLINCVKSQKANLGELVLKETSVDEQDVWPLVRRHFSSNADQMFTLLLSENKRAVLFDRHKKTAGKRKRENMV